MYTEKKAKQKVKKRWTPIADQVYLTMKFTNINCMQGKVHFKS